MRRLTIAIVLFLILLFGASTPGFAQATTDPYTTNLGLRYDFFSHAFEESSGTWVRCGRHDACWAAFRREAAGAPAAASNSRSSPAQC